ncbi:glycogen synthase [Brevibacterium sp. NPDC049920]|uniref:Glycogen synthase n=1 Tax=Brevibacterium pityocampae TaxID=506594 RepID=A0ABP8JCU5_9MICO|nr:glycogen synthase [uncultured Brevibacterium sp.]
MRTDIVSKEFPPEVYGGAGVHVAELSAVLAMLIDVRVHAFGDRRDIPYATGYPELSALADQNAAIRTLGVDLSMIAGIAGADLVHSHTWYANMAGHLASLMYDIPHVLSAHSLEPLRPWKAEQLGGGYAISSWAERTAYEHSAGVIAVSEGMKRDILRVYPQIDPGKVRVVYNGIDSSAWQPNEDTAVLDEYGIDPRRPSVVFVGRVTRQKGLPYLLRAVALLPEDVQVVLCAGAPDTPEIAQEVAGLVAELQETRSGVVFIDTVLPREKLTQLLTHATTFVCPSVYEPLGIVNLEAMACGAPVVGTATGGIPEVVLDGDTGIIVPIDQLDDGTGTPKDPEAFVRDLAEGLTRMVSDPDRAREMGRRGRQRAVDTFSWEQIGRETVQVYESLLR